MFHKVIAQRMGATIYYFKDFPSSLSPILHKTETLTLPEHSGRPESISIKMRILPGNEELVSLFDKIINHPVMQTLDLLDKASPNQKFGTRVHTENQQMMMMAALNRDFDAFKKCPSVVEQSNLSLEMFNHLADMASNLSRMMKRAIFGLIAWHDVGKSEYNRKTLAPSSDANDHCVVGKAIVTSTYYDIDIRDEFGLSPEIMEIIRDAIPYHAAPGMILQGETSAQILDLVMFSMRKHPDWADEILDFYHVHASLDVISAVPGFLHENIIGLNSHLFSYLRPAILHALKAMSPSRASSYLEEKFKEYVSMEMESLIRPDSTISVLTDKSRHFEAFRIMRQFRFYWSDHSESERIHFLQIYDRVVDNMFKQAPEAKANYIEMLNRYRDGYELWYLPALASNLANQSEAMINGKIMDEQAFSDVLDGVIRLTYYSMLARDQYFQLTEGVYKSVNFMQINDPLQKKNIDVWDFLSVLRSVPIGDDEALIPRPSEDFIVGDIQFKSEQYGLSVAPVFVQNSSKRLRRYDGNKDCQYKNFALS